MKAFRFRIYPGPEHEERLLATVEACRRLWNDSLAHRKRRWEEEGRQTSYNLQQWILTSVRNSDPELQSVHSQVAQDVLHRVDRAFKSFFEHRASYPRFKKRRESGSFTYPQAYNGSVKPDVLRKRFYFSKIGNVMAVFHRTLPRDMMLKTCTVTREPCGEWYASLVYEPVVPLQDVKVPQLSQMELPAIGIDLGLMALVTTSDGEKIEPPKFLRKADSRLKHLQKELSRKKNGSNNRWRTRRRVASLHAKVSRQRADFNHKLSRRLVREHNLVVFEDLRICNMMRNHHLAKSIVDAGWGQLVAFAEYKAKAERRTVVLVDAQYSSQKCSWCGVMNNISLNVRKFTCIGCSRTLDRDVNAARIVLKRGIAKVGQDVPELKPVETGPLLAPKRGAHVWSWKQEPEAHGFGRGRISHIQFLISP